MSSRNAAKRRQLKTKLFGGRRTRCCKYCRMELTFEQATIDHKMPLSRGGGWDQGNLCISCKPCNERKGDMTAQEYLALFRAAAAPSPEAVMPDADPTPRPASL